MTHLHPCFSIFVDLPVRLADKFLIIRFLTIFNIFFSRLIQIDFDWRRQEWISQWARGCWAWELFEPSRPDHIFKMTMHQNAWRKNAWRKISQKILSQLEKNFWKKLRQNSTHFFIRCNASLKWNTDLSRSSYGLLL